MKILNYLLSGYHYLLYLNKKTLKGYVDAIFHALCFLYILELFAPFAYFFKNGLPIYMGSIAAAFLAFYNDYIFNSEIMVEIEYRFDVLNMNYFLILIQWVVFLFCPFVVLISLINI